MINVKKIYNEILSDERLLNVISEDNIFDCYPNEVETFPCVIYMEGVQMDIEFADNLPTANSCNVDIHIFTKALENYPTTSEIGIIIGEIFKEKYFTCTSNLETYDENPEVRHRIMSFRKEIFS